MENVENKQDEREALGIDHLLSHLRRFRAKSTRLNEDEVSSIFRQLRHELPYFNTPTASLLASALGSDAPFQKTDTSLNDVIVSLGKALCDASQYEDLSELIEIYLIERKKTEKDYAINLASFVLTEADFAAFPEKAKAPLKKLALTILEKIIDEKQSRKMLGYQPHSLMDIIEPIIHNKALAPELDRLKSAFPIEFRKIVNIIAQNAYEKTSDETILGKILKEKEIAFENFLTAITSKEPNDTALTKLQNKIWFAQRDKNQKHELLMKQLDIFFKSINPKSNLGSLSLQLRLRLSDVLRKKITAADHNIEIYAREDLIKQAHETVFNEVEYDANSMRIILDDVLAIQEKFSKKMLRRLTGQKYLKNIENALLDIFLGKTVKKRNLVTDEIEQKREGGYPYKSISELFAESIASLQKIRDELSGFFTADFKNEMTEAIDDLIKSSKDLKIISATILTQPALEVNEYENTETTNTSSETVADKAPQITLAQSTSVSIDEEPSVTLEKTEPKPLMIEDEPEITLEKFEPKPLIIEVEPEITLEKIEPKPLIIEEEPEITFEKVEPKPLIIEEEPEITLEKVEPKPLIIEDEPEVTLEKIEPKPLIIEEEPEITFEKVEPKPLIIEDEPEVTLEKIEPKPLMIEDEPEVTFEKVEPKPLIIEDEPEITLEKIEPKPLIIEKEPEFTFEKVEPKPLIIEEEPEITLEKTDPIFNTKEIEPEVQASPEPAKEIIAASMATPQANSQAIQDSIDAGIAIMGNYDLSDLEQPILQAWKSMVMTSATTASDDIQAGDFGNENEIHLYVICDLAQQIASLATKIPAENQPRLIRIKNQILDALKNPLDQDNWQCFEGMKRDAIDRTLVSLQ